MYIRLKVKPTIYRQYGVWFCSRGRSTPCWGVGNTPREAYISWRRHDYATHLSKG